MMSATKQGFENLLSGRAINVPQISGRIYGGSSMRKLPHDFPAEMKGNEWDLLCGYFRLISLWNPWGYFHVEISLVLPSKVSKCK